MPLEVKPCGRAHAHCRVCRPEVARHIGDAERGIPKTPEAVAKTAAAHRGKPLSPEHRQHISDGLRGRHPSPQHRRNVSRGLRAYFHEEGSRPTLSTPAPVPPPSSPHVDRFGQPAPEKPSPTGTVTFVFAKGEHSGRSEYGDGHLSCPGNEYHVVLENTGEEVFARGKPAVRGKVKVGDRVALKLGRGHSGDWVTAVI